MKFTRYWGQSLKTSSFTISPNEKYTVTTHTDNAILSFTDYNQVNRMNSTSSKQYTLPEITSSDIGKRIIVRKVNTGAVTIARSGSDTIEGATSISCSTADTDAFIVLMAVALTDWEVFENMRYWA